MPSNLKSVRSFAMVLGLAVATAGCDTPEDLSSLSSKRTTRCIAHRGLHLDEPNQDNSYQAVMRAVDLANEKNRRNAGVEFDVQRTSDGFWVLLHEDGLNPDSSDISKWIRSKSGKRCELDKGVSELTLDNLNENCVLADGSAIPTLRQVLEGVFMDANRSQFVKEIGFTFIVDIKDEPDSDLVQTLDSFFNEISHLLRLTSFENDFLQRYADLDRESKYRRLDLTRFNEWENSDEVEGLNTRISRYSLDGLDLQDVLDLQSLGKEVGVWEWNHRLGKLDFAFGLSEIQRYIDLGVDFITTDSYTACLDLTKSNDSVKGEKETQVELSQSQ